MKSWKSLLGTVCALVLAACGGSGGGGGGSGGLGVSGTPGNSGAAAAYAESRPETPLLAPTVEPELAGVPASTVDNSRDQARPAIDAARVTPASSSIYRVYATNGMELSLSINFDNYTFEMTGTDEATARGTFSEDAAEPGSYIFNSPRITGAANTARFRVTTDAIVGAFPFSKANITPATYAVQAFVAARTFVKDATELDGTYNRFGVSRVGSAADSLAQQIRIYGGGTMLQLCNSPLGGALGTCPSNMVFDYPLAAGPDGTWSVRNSGSAEEAVAFRVARIGGQNVYLAAGAPSDTTGRRVMKIALPDTPIPFFPVSARGAATDGTYGKVTMTYTNYSTRYTSPDATTNGFAYWGGTISGTSGMRVVNSQGSDRYLAIRSDALVVATSVPATWGSGAKGYMQIGLITGQPSIDPRNGYYAVFATNGWRHTLALDFDTQTYGVSDEAFHSTAGKFEPDAYEAGTFVFDSTRITAPGNTARFRTTNGAVVAGAFPFVLGQPTSTIYSVQPFFAMSTSLSGTDLDGTYNRSSLAVSGTGGTVRHQQVRISGAGTSMVICQDAALLTVDSCPEASKVSYALSPTFDPKTRRYVNLSNAADTGEISAGRITTLVGNLFITQNILASSSDALRTNAPAFSIALQDTSAWPAVSARGASNFDASTDGAQVLRAPWNSVALNASQYLRSSSFPDGSTKSIALAVEAPESGAPQNMRRVSGGAYNGVVMQAGRLAVMTGSVGPREGIVELSLID